MTAPQIAPPVQEKLQQAANHGRPWLQKLARLGYAAKGTVYIVIGMLAFLAAFGQGGQTTDSQGALHKIAGQPFGTVLLTIVAVGLVGYALWRLVQAAFDADEKGSDAKGVLTRLGYAISGFAYGGLALTAFRILSHSRSGGGDAQKDWTARLLAQPLGQWLVGFVALVIVGLGLNAFAKAYSAKFREKLGTAGMSEVEDKVVTVIGRVGYSARGVVLLIIGWFFLNAARAADARQSGGLEKALDSLAKETPWLLAVVAVGLVAYGIFALAEARYRKI